MTPRRADEGLPRAALRRRRRDAAALLLGAVAVLWAMQARGQPVAERDGPRWGAWVTASLQGVGAVGASGGGGATGAVTLARGVHAGTVRVAVLADVSGFPDSGGGEVASEVALLYGRVRGDGSVRLAWSAGLAAVHFDACPGSEFRGGCSTVGVPVVAEAALTTPVAGVALQAVANANPEAPWFGVGIALRLGWMPAG